jgi:hypothetical protein
LRTPEILAAGGFRYSSRLRELRQQGHRITCKALGESVFVYVLEAEAADPEPLPDYSRRTGKALRDVAMPLFARTDFRP